jgi:TPR repeat protein
MILGYPIHYFIKHYSFEMYSIAIKYRFVMANISREMAENGCVTLQMLYAHCLMLDRDVRRSDVQAAQYFKMAAHRGSLYAQLDSGVDHLSGIELTRDEEAAIGYFRNVADCSPLARALLGSLPIRRTNLCTRLDSAIKYR